MSWEGQLTKITGLSHQEKTIHIPWTRHENVKTVICRKDLEAGSEKWQRKTKRDAAVCHHAMKEHLYENDCQYRWYKDADGHYNQLRGMGNKQKIQLRVDAVALWLCDCFCIEANLKKLPALPGRQV